MVKVNKNLKKKQAEEEALKKKLLESMKLSIDEEEDSDEEVEDEEVEGSGSEVEENDDEESDEEDEEVATLDKSVYEESDEEDDDEEEADDDDEEDDDEEEVEEAAPVKAKKSKEPAAKKQKLEKVEEPEDSEEEDDDDEEVTEEPIKRVAEVENRALKRKLERSQKKNKKGTEEESNFEKIKVEELPLTCYLANLPHNLGKNGIVEALKPFTGFQRIFFQGVKESKQPLKFFVVFENKEQRDQAIEKEITLKNPKNPNLTGKKIKLVPTKWTIFNSLSGHCVCVKGLTKNITENDLKKKFQGFGEVLKIELVTKAQGSDLKFPFAYIFFKEVESASKVVETGTLEINSVKVDVHAFHTKKRENTNDEDSIQIETNQGAPVTLDECSRTLHVSNAHHFATNQEIEKLMSKYGEVNRVLSQVVKSQTKKTEKFFKVVFENSEGYSNALKAKKLVLGKRNLHKSPIKWNSLSELQPHMVKVDGLPAEASKEDLVKMFEIFGTIAKIDIIKPKKRTNTIAFVYYNSTLSAKKAVALDGTQFEGQTLSVHQRRTQGKGAENAVFIKKPDSQDVTKEAVEKELQTFGPIFKVHDGKKNFVVTFKKSADATKALNSKKVKVAGVAIELERHQLNNKNSSAVLVTGLAKDTKIEQVVKHFKGCGKVLKKYIGSSKRSSGARTTFAYLEFGKQEEKTKALKLSKTSLNGKVIFVSNSKPRV